MAHKQRMPRTSSDLTSNIAHKQSIPRTTPRSRLMELPEEIRRIIFEQLQTTDLLFVPRYSANDEYGDLGRKSREYYGQPTKDDIASSRGLLNLSATCRYFRKITAPSLFRCVVLRSKRRSIESITLLSRGPHWQHVKSLIFAGTSETGDELYDGNSIFGSVNRYCGDTSKKPPQQYRTVKMRAKLKEQLRGLAGILASLPPNLESLTLDFPQSWNCGRLLRLVDRSKHLENDGEAEALWRADRYRAILYTVVQAVCRNDISSKTKFELRLHNTPPCGHTAWKSFARISKHATSFTLSFSHYGYVNDPYARTDGLMTLLARNLAHTFFNDLSNVKTFKVHADRSWHLGLGVGGGEISLQLPTPGGSGSMSSLQHVSLHHIVINDGLSGFLVSQSLTLKSLELKDCAALHHGPHPMLGQQRWARFFTSLAAARPGQLTHIRVYNSPTDVTFRYKDAYRMAPTDVVKAAKDILAVDCAAEYEKCLHGADLPEILRRRREIFRYVTSHWRNPNVFDNAQMTLESFRIGNDYAAYLQLVELVEHNIQRAHAGV